MWHNYGHFLVWWTTMESSLISTYSQNDVFIIFLKLKKWEVRGWTQALIHQCVHDNCILLECRVVIPKAGWEYVSNLWRASEGFGGTQPLVIAERFKFHNCKQQSSQLVADFVAQLKKLASKCKFEGHLSEHFATSLCVDCVITKLSNTYSL